MSDKKLRTKVVALRLNESEMQELQDLACKEAMPLTTLVRRVMLRLARESK